MVRRHELKLSAKRAGALRPQGEVPAGSTGAMCTGMTPGLPAGMLAGAHAMRATVGMPWTGAMVESPELIEGQPVYGEPIGHPAMAFAPVNEASLAILFGAMAVQLGFSILRAQQPCPDVEAMRKMNGGWQIQKIELEIESINFLRHMHDRRDVDLIVCWKHNWKDCPVPVLELSKLLA